MKGRKEREGGEGDKEAACGVYGTAALPCPYPILDGLPCHAVQHEGAKERGREGGREGASERCGGVGGKQGWSEGKARGGER